MADQYRLPDGRITTSQEEYAKAWAVLGHRIREFFPGYVLSAMDPMLRFELREVSSRTGQYTVVDSFDLSPTAANCLLSKTAPPRMQREDL